jgi:histone-lysine N-methyltransferase SUV420H
VHVSLYQQLTIMPAQPAADLAEALKKKGGLTLSQLANYDDLITDGLVDKVCVMG